MTEEVEYQSCPNCGHPLKSSDAYCSSCGQKNEAVIITFKEMVLDTLGAFFAFDSKAIKSIPKLLFLPGSLTAEYVRGKRQSYLAPTRLYLFFSIILFLLLPLVVTDKTLFEGQDNFTAIADSLASIPEENGGNIMDSIINAVQSELDSSRANSPGGKRINWSIQKENTPAIQFGPTDTTENGSWYTALKLVESGMSPMQASDSVFREQNKLTRILIGQGLKLQTRKGEGLVSAFLDTTSYALFLFLPLFALALKLLYIRRKRFYIEHMVFSLHFFTLMFILISLYILCFRFIAHFPFWIIWLISIFYLLLAMHRFYRQSWGKTFLKWFALNMLTTVIFLPLFFGVAIVLSLLIY